MSIHIAIDNNPKKYGHIFTAFLNIFCRCMLLFFLLHSYLIDNLSEMRVRFFIAFLNGDFSSLCVAAELSILLPMYGILY